jgi:hypothetical protein
MRRETGRAPDREGQGRREDRRGNGIDTSIPTTTVHIREVDLTDSDVVRIDRRSVWGNPHKMASDGSNRAEVIEAFREYILTRHDLLGYLDELRGKRLACWCAPLPCHGDVLIELIDHPELIPAPIHGCAGAHCRVPGCEWGHR